MEIGCLYLYKSDVKKAKYKLVVITSGQFGGRISNFWRFAYIDESTGMLTKYTGHDYDNEKPTKPYFQHYFFVFIGN